MREIEKQIQDAQLAATLNVLAENGICLPHEVTKYNVGFGTAIEFRHKGNKVYVGPSNITFS